MGVISESGLAYIIYLETIIANYSHVAVAALFVYDMLLTFSQEVSHIWARRFTGMTVLFAVNRSSALAQKILIIMQMTPLNGMSTKRSAKHTSSKGKKLDVLSYLVIAFFFALRVYAITGRDWRPSLIVCFLGLGLPGAVTYQEVVTTYWVSTSPSPVNGGCQSNTAFSLRTYLLYVSSPFVTVSLLTDGHRLATITRCAAVAADLITLAITLRKTLNLRKVGSDAGVGTRLVSLLLRDGTLYFATILLLNTLDIILLHTTGFGAVADVITTLSIILISRSMLNLREIYPEDGHTSAAQFSTIRFASSVIGTLGAPLEHNEGNL
ncbi:unnamed protein product [Somion occarium]|uniref:DUF6533 domain-containing protein n=1 Tax=Somion occarium TaxID=3059160 RepID=A0ABP1CTS2_9APHY